jgi:hypothetical protein
MELEVNDSYGWLRYDCNIALNIDELQQLRLAMSLARVHVSVPIIDEFLEMTDDL